MDIDQINAKIANKDRSLGSQNKSVGDRIDLVKIELCPDINDLGNRFLDGTHLLSDQELERLFSTFQVDNWYLENYGYKQTPDSLIIKQTPFLMQGEIWYFTHSEKNEYCNILECTNLPEIVKQNLIKREIEYLKDSFKCSKQKLQTIKYLDDVVFYRNKERKNDPDAPFVIPNELNNNFYLDKETINFISFAIEDLNLAIVTLKNTRDYQFVIFPATQAIEKLLKACLIEEKLPISGKTSEELRQSFITKYGHKILDILPELDCYLENTSTIEMEIKKIPYAEEMLKKPVTKNPRYDVIEISLEQAVEVIDATLNVFELVSDKFITPLHRAMYYPELEEGYDKYYAQLEDVEDDDFFLEE